MSILDTSLADPTSPASPDNTPSAWTAFRRANDPVWAAERATRCAAIRDELDEQIVRPRTTAELRADIERFNEWLVVTPVQAGTDFANWVRARKAKAVTELANLTSKAGTR